MGIDQGVLGVGNILLRDEGFGVFVVRYMEEQFKLPEGTRLLDGGTSGISLLDYVKGLNRLLIIDAIKEAAPPGTLVEFSSDEIELLAPSLRMSPHQVGILDLLSILRFEGSAPKEIDFLCVVPKELSTGLGLSEELEALVPVAARKAYEWANHA